MRAAPSCTLALPDPHAERMVLSALHALAAGVLMAWAGLAVVWPPPVLAAALVLATLLGAVLGLTWGARPLHRRGGTAHALHWSGRGWHLLPSAAGAVTPESALAGLTVAMDLGPWMLLQARRAGAADAWLVVRPSAAEGSAWAALRVALAAHAGVSPAAVDNQALVG